MRCCYIYVNDINCSLEPGEIIRSKFSHLFIFRVSPFLLASCSFIVILTVVTARVKKFLAIKRIKVLWLIRATMSELAFPFTSGSLHL